MQYEAGSSKQALAGTDSPLPGSRDREGISCLHSAGLSCLSPHWREQLVQADAPLRYTAEELTDPNIQAETLRQVGGQLIRSSSHSLRQVFSLGKSRQQVRRMDVEPAGEDDEGFECRVSLSSLQAADVGAVQADVSSEVLLRHCQA